MAYVSIDEKQASNGALLRNNAPIAPADFSKISITPPLTAEQRPAAIPYQSIADSKQSLTVGQPTVIQKLVSILPTPLKSPAEFVLNDISEGLFGSAQSREMLRAQESAGYAPDLPTILKNEGMLPFLGRTQTDRVEHIAQKLEDAGTDKTRAADIAFYDVFGTGNPTDKQVQEAKKQFASMTLTKPEQHVLTLAHIGQFLGSGADIAGALPVGFIADAAKLDLVRLLVKAKTPEAAASLLRSAGVSEDLIDSYAPKFATLTDKTEIQRGVDSLIHTMETTSAPKYIGIDEHPADTTKAAAVEPLAAQAAKYGSAEEFINAQTPIQQFTEEGRTGKFWAPQGAADEGFGTIKNEAFLDNSKIFKGQSSRDFLIERGLWDQKFPELRKYGADTFKEMEAHSAEGTGYMAKDPNIYYKAMQDKAEEILKKEGYSGAHWTSEDDLNPTQFQIWDRSAIKTQSQLEDIYKSAKTTIIDKLPPVPQQPSAEEIASLDRSAQAQRAPDEMPHALSPEGRDALQKISDLRSLKPGMSAREAAARDALDTARQHRDMMRDLAGDMPGRDLAKFEDKQHPGTLPEILGKVGKETRKGTRKALFNLQGDQILDNALGYRQHGWNDIEDAEKALQDYKNAKAQARQMDETVRTHLKALKRIQAEDQALSRKTIVDDLVHYVNQQGAERVRKVQAVQDFFKLSTKEMGKIMRNERDLKLMNDGEFDDFMKRIEGKATESYMRAGIKADIESTIFEKELVKTENLQKAYHYPKLQNMSTQQMKDFNTLLHTFKTGDEFLGVRQLQTVKNTDLAGIHTKREALERLLSDINANRARTGKPLVTMEDLNKIHVDTLDKFRYDVALARRNPLYDLMVHELHKSLLNADASVLETRDTVDGLFKEARGSRERGFLDKAIPFDTKIFNWLSASDADKIKMADEMTGEELKAASYVQQWYAEARDYLVQQKVLKRFIQDYVTHTRRGFLEAWREESQSIRGNVSGDRPGRLKSAGKGLLAATKDIWKAHQEEEAFFNIMNEKTGDVLPLEKFFQYSMTRTNELVPSKNVAKAFLKYASTFEKKKMLDSIVPKLDIYVHSLTPKKLTPRGLEFDDSLKRFFKQWMNSKKGRPMDVGIIKPGDKVDWMLRTGVAMTRLLDLGFNIPIGIASNMGAQAAVYRGLGEKAYATGAARLASKRGRDILTKYQNLVGRSVWKTVTGTDTSLGDSLADGIFGLFSAADRKSRQVFLLGSMTPKEYATGELSLDRLADVKLAMGRQLPMSDMKSIAGKTSLGAVGTQYRSWAVPLLSSSLDDLSKAAQAIKGADIGFVRSPEFAELMRTALLSATVGLGGYGLLTDKRPRNQLSFTEKLMQGAARDALSLIGALNPSFWTSPARLMQFVNDLGTALTQIVMVDKNQNGEMTGVNTLKRTVVPVAIRQFLPPQESSSKKKGALPSLPKLPKLPSLPKLPKIGSK